MPSRSIKTVTIVLCSKEKKELPVIAVIHPLRETPQICRHTHQLWQQQMKLPQQNSETNVKNNLDKGISRITVSGPFFVVLDHLLL